MADHLRKAVRDATAEALTGLATTGANVFSGRISPLKPNELPGLVVFLNLEDATEGAYNAGATVDRSGTLRVEAVCKANDETIDTLDQIAVEVEEALFADEEFLDLLMVTPSPPATTITIDEPVDGLQHRLGTLILQFPILYRTRLGEPDTQA